MVTLHAQNYATLIGGLAIALLRVLYVIFPAVILPREHTMANLLTMVSFLTMVTTTIVHTSYTKRDEVLETACMGRSQDLTKMVFEIEHPHQPPITIHILITTGMVYF